MVLENKERSKVKWSFSNKKIFLASISFAFDLPNCIELLCDVLIENNDQIDGFEHKKFKQFHSYEDKIIFLLLIDLKKFWREINKYVRKNA